MLNTQCSTYPLWFVIKCCKITIFKIAYFYIILFLKQWSFFWKYLWLGLGLNQKSMPYVSVFHHLDDTKPFIVFQILIGGT